MRVLLFICLLAVSSIASGQIPDPFEYKVIDSVSNAQQSELYIRANKWMIKQVNASRKSEIQLQDSETGQIIGKMTIQVPNLNHMSGIDYVTFSIFIDVKDEKYRIVCSGYAHEKGTSLNDKTIKLKFGMSNSANDNWKRIRKSAHEQTQELLADFNNAMNTRHTDDF